MPESAVDASEIDELEAVLDRHGVIYLTAGVRQRSPRPGRLGENWVHMGVNPRLGKGGGPPDGPGRLRCTIPNEVIVRTADPGSSASTLA